MDSLVFGSAQKKSFSNTLDAQGFGSVPKQRPKNVR